MNKRDTPSTKDLKDLAEELFFTKEIRATLMDVGFIRDTVYEGWPDQTDTEWEHNTAEVVALLIDLTRKNR